MTESDLPESLPGFDRPIDLLRACHTKILAHCDLLEELILHLQEGQTDAAELRSTARKIITYFTTSSRQHHQDEEVELFARLARQSLKLADMVHSLKQEHTELDTLWMALEPELMQGDGIHPKPAAQGMLLANVWPSLEPLLAP